MPAPFESRTYEGLTRVRIKLATSSEWWENQPRSVTLERNSTLRTFDESINGIEMVFDFREGVTGFANSEDDIRFLTSVIHTKLVDIQIDPWVEPPRPGLILQGMAFFKTRRTSDVRGGRVTTIAVRFAVSQSTTNRVPVERLENVDLRQQTTAEMFDAPPVSAGTVRTSPDGITWRDVSSGSAADLVAHRRPGGTYTSLPVIQASGASVMSLPQGVSGVQITISNTNNHTVSVVVNENYRDTINGLPEHSQGPGTVVTYTCYGGGRWLTSDPTVVSRESPSAEVNMAAAEAVQRRRIVEHFDRIRRNILSAMHDSIEDGLSRDQIHQIVASAVPGLILNDDTVSFSLVEQIPDGLLGSVMELLTRKPWRAVRRNIINGGYVTLPNNPGQPTEQSKPPAKPKRRFRGNIPT